MDKPFLEITDGFYDDREPIYRTIAKVFIPPEFIIKLIRGEIEVDPAIFPEDVSLVDSEWDDKSKSFVLTLSSKEYYAVAAGNVPMYMTLRLRKAL